MSMRRTCIRMLDGIGLGRFARDVRNRQFMRRYEGKDQHTVSHRGLEVHFATRDLYTKRWFYPRYEGDRVHEPKVTDAILQSLNHDSCFVDVGANVGYFTCFAAKVCRRVYAFEMDERFGKMLLESVKLNQLDNVELVQSAVGAQAGEVQYRPGDMPHLSNPASRNRGGMVTVPMVSLDAFFGERGEHPTLLKIDVQGAETMVLRGMTRLLDEDRPRLLIEVHPELLQDLGSHAREPLDILLEAGYRIYEIEGLRDQSQLDDMREVEPTWVPPNDSMLLAVPREQSDEVG